MLEKATAILGMVAVSNTTISTYKMKPLPLDIRNCRSLIKIKQTKKKSTIASDKLSFSLLMKRNALLSDTTKDKHKGQDI